MRNTPLPFMNAISPVVGNKKTAEEKIQEEREKLAKTFESAKTKKESRKKEFEEKRDDAKKAKKGLKGDEKKAARYNVQRINREERKKRAEDRKQQWAEKRFLQGKYDSVDQAKKRFETMQDLTSKQNQTFQGIMGSVGGTSNDPETEASEATYDANTYPVTDAAMDADNYTKGFGSGIYNA
jgi:chromosome segregation ATPase